MEMPRLYAAQFGVEAFWPLMAQAGRTLLLNTPQRHQEELHAIAQHSRLGDDRIAVANTLLELRRIGCSSLIVEPSRSATGGPLFGRNFDFPTLGRLQRMDDDEIISRLVQVRGIGRWTVEMLLIFRLGRPDVLPTSDLGVRKGFMLTYGGSELPSAAELLLHAERWRPYRTIGSWYMWRAVESAQRAAAGIQPMQS